MPGVSRNFRRTRYRGVERTSFAAYLVAAAYNLLRIGRSVNAAVTRQRRDGNPFPGRESMRCCASYHCIVVEACGPGDEFSVVQKNVVRLRDNLLRNTRGKQRQAG